MLRRTGSKMTRKRLSTNQHQSQHQQRPSHAHKPHQGTTATDRVAQISNQELQKLIAPRKRLQSKCGNTSAAVAARGPVRALGGASTAAAVWFATACAEHPGSPSESLAMVQQLVRYWNMAALLARSVLFSCENTKRSVPASYSKVQQYNSVFIVYMILYMYISIRSIIHHIGTINRVHTYSCNSFALLYCLC